MAPYRRGRPTRARPVSTRGGDRPVRARADPGPEGGYQTWPPGAALLSTVLLIVAETDQDKLLLREDVLTW